MQTILSILLASFLTAWSFAAIVLDSYAGPYRTLAERLEAGRDTLRDGQRIARLEQALAGGDDLMLCSRELVRSAISIRLALLDASYRNGDSLARQDALAKAGETLRYGIWCFPRDGHFWLRLAMVEFAQSGPSRGVEAMLQTSRATAPSEAWVMVPRIEFASKLLDARLPGVGAVLQADVQDFAKYGVISRVARLHAEMGEPARRIFVKALEGLDDDRLAAVQRAILSQSGQGKEN